MFTSLVCLCSLVIKAIKSQQHGFITIIIYGNKIPHLDPDIHANNNNNNNKKFIFQVISNTKQRHHEKVQVHAEVAFVSITIVHL